jgi:hypothetical protein
MMHAHTSRSPDSCVLRRRSGTRGHFVVYCRSHSAMRLLQIVTAHGFECTLDATDGCVDIRVDASTDAPRQTFTGVRNRRTTYRKANYNAVFSWSFKCISPRRCHHDSQHNQDGYYSFSGTGASPKRRLRRQAMFRGACPVSYTTNAENDSFYRSQRIRR